MRADAVRADRAHEVRSAARDWRRSGAIDDETLARIEGAYPDDRTRARTAFRVLFFIFTAFAVLALFGLLIVAGLDGVNQVGILAIGFGAVLFVLTEAQIGPLRRDRGGTEEATALLAVLFLMGGAGWFISEHLSLKGRAAVTSFLIVCAALLAAAAWRWGFALSAAGAGLLAFWALARFPHGRVLWAAAGALAFVPLLRASESARLAPSHRRACAAALLVTIVALYAAVSIYSLDHRLVEGTGGGTGGWDPLFSTFGIGAGTAGSAAGPPGLPWTLIRIFSVVLTAAFPASLIAAGVLGRRRVLLDAGGLLAALSLLTVRAYVHVAATWLVLALAGGGLIALALVLKRWLNVAPGKEWRGFTAEPLFEDPSRGRAFEIAATLAATSPAARKLPSEPEFRGQGGASGGAGAGGEF